MHSEGEFKVGFWFAILVAKTLGLETCPDEIYNRLRQIANGDLTLMPSPEEALREAELHLGRPLRSDEMEVFKESVPKNRTEQDIANRERAKLILRLAGRLQGNS